MTPDALMLDLQSEFGDLIRVTAKHTPAFSVDIPAVDAELRAVGYPTELKRVARAAYAAGLREQLAPTPPADQVDALFRTLAVHANAEGYVIDRRGAQRIAAALTKGEG